eukprot:TRINITY_DN4913_c0_g2_i3.p1 TRINITY_DN4913_c0_g2~~TRINITY_DN4913_c0_g2_i3.p1  ORF type:complete len:374 (-),score=124.74 TRINITY_DN4913_c0_g2_i3:502-1560(-)
MEETKPFFDLSVKEILPHSSNVIQVESNDTLKHVAQILSKSEIYSVPVYDKENKKYDGLLDFGDIVSFIITSLYKKVENLGESHEERIANLINASFVHKAADHARKHLPTSQHKELNHHIVELSGEFMEVCLNLHNTPAKLLTNFSKKNNFISFSETSSLRSVVEALNNGAQRIPIIDPSTGLISNYVTQSLVVKFVAKNLKQLSPIANQDLGKLGVCQKKIVGVSEHSIALEAFAKMHEFGVSGLPILDDQNHFFGALSVKDIKLALLDFSNLLLPAREYISAVRSLSTYETNPTIYCKLSDTLTDVIKKLIAIKIHRLFLVEDTKKFIPVGVISHRDVLHLLLSHTLAKN